MFDREYSQLEVRNNRLEAARRALDNAIMDYRIYEGNLKTALQEEAKEKGTEGWPEWATTLISL